MEKVLNDEKASGVKIVNVTCTVLDMNGRLGLYGLGDDGLMYFWNYSNGKWYGNWQGKQERELLRKTKKESSRKKK